MVVSQMMGPLNVLSFARLNLEIPYLILPRVWLKRAPSLTPSLQQACGLGVAKEWARLFHPARVSPDFQLEADDVGSLRALGAFADFKLDCLAIGKVAVSLSLDRGEMHEDIGARLALNESETFAGVKPLYCSLFFQLCFLFLMGYLVPLERPSAKNKKGREL